MLWPRRLLRKKKPLLTPEEKKTIHAACNILKRLSKEWKKLEMLVEADCAKDRFLEKLDPDHIDILDGNAFIDLGIGK